MIELDTHYHLREHDYEVCDICGEEDCLVVHTPPPDDPIVSAIRQIGRELRTELRELGEMR